MSLDVVTPAMRPGVPHAAVPMRGRAVRALVAAAFLALAVAAAAEGAQSSAADAFQLPGSNDSKVRALSCLAPFREATCLSRGLRQAFVRATALVCWSQMLTSRCRRVRASA